MSEYSSASPCLGGSTRYLLRHSGAASTVTRWGYHARHVHGCHVPVVLPDGGLLRRRGWADTQGQADVTQPSCRPLLLLAVLLLSTPSPHWQVSLVIRTYIEECWVVKLFHESLNFKMFLQNSFIYLFSFIAHNVKKLCFWYNSVDS